MYLEKDELEQRVVCKQYIDITNLTKRINQALKEVGYDYYVKRGRIISWLVQDGVLYHTENSKSIKNTFPTVIGKSLGIGMAQGTQVKYSPYAQRYIVQNLDKIITHHPNIKVYNDAEADEDETEWTELQDALLIELFRRKVEMEQIIDIIGFEREDVQERILHLMKTDRL